jgi:sulfopropanediol 3-dehydrogenase
MVTPCFPNVNPDETLCREIAEVTERQCNLENMLAHGITARARIERYNKG